MISECTIVQWRKTFVKSEYNAVELASDNFRDGTKKLAACLKLPGSIWILEVKFVIVIRFVQLNNKCRLANF